MDYAAFNLQQNKRTNYIVNVIDLVSECLCVDCSKAKTFIYSIKVRSASLLNSEAMSSHADLMSLAEL